MVQFHVVLPRGDGVGGEQHPVRLPSSLRTRADGRGIVSSSRFNTTSVLSYFFLRAGDFFDFLAVGFFEGLFAFAAGFFAGLRRGPVDAVDAPSWTPGSHDFLAAGFAAGLRAAGFATVFFLAGDLAAGLRAAGFFFLAEAGGPLPEPARSRARSSRLALSIGSS